MEITFEKIKQKKVREFLKTSGLGTSTAFQNFRAVCYQPSAAHTYRKHLQTFFIRKDIDTVWSSYKWIHPSEAWNGTMASFGLQYSRNRNAITYIDDTYAGIEKGLIIILNLRIFWGLLHLAVAHEVTEVNEQEHTIKLCYMTGGASEGSQWIKLNPTPDGFTEVTHLTYYKSKSRFRDTRLYPRLHSKAITEFHDNIRQRAERLF